MFFSLEISAKMLFTKHPLSFKFVLSVLSIIFDMLTSCQSFFRDVATSIIVFAIISAFLSGLRSLISANIKDKVVWRIS